MSEAKKKLVKAKFSHKKPKQILKTNFSSLERYEVVNYYSDDSASKKYNCDILMHKGFDAVGIVPYLYINNELHVLLLSNFRAPAFFREAMDKPSEIPKEILEFIEIPAGIIDKEDRENETNIENVVKKCASRELFEECGYALKPNMIDILYSYYYTAPGIIAEKIYITTCNITGKRQKEIKTDGSVMEENMETFILPITTAIEYIQKGIIKNAATEIALSRLYYKLVVEKEMSYAKIISKRLNMLNNVIGDLKKESEYYNKLIREFRATISHELKHPFTEIINYLNILNKDDVSEEIRKKSMDVLQSSIRKIYDNNRNLLEISFGADRIQQTTECFDIHDTILDIVNQYRLAYKYDIDVNIDIEERCKYLIGFEDRFRIILEGILSNALKFTKKGSINITVKIIDSSSIGTRKIDFMPDLFNYHVLGNIKPYEIEFIIKDTGVGIKSRLLKKIFIPFYQTDSRFTREYGGMGIGLSVVKDFIESMQGSIKIDSSIGVGTTVTLNVAFGLREE